MHETIPFGPTMTIERYQLDNGLVVLALVDDSAPVISYQTWFRVGSRHEREGKTGIAHLFEHLMFNETENLPCGEFDRTLEQAGVDNNAATFLDWTYYVENLPKEALELVVKLEADRMQNLVLRSEQLESEREVVSNERRQTVDDDVDGAVTEQLYIAAFTTHGYRWPTIGSMADIAGLSLEDCQHFYRTYYAPNNATIVAVGDLDVTALLDLISQHYGRMEASVLPVEDAWPEPPQIQERRQRVRQPCANSRLAIGYKSPALGDFDHAPLVLLNEILFGGRSSRAYRTLVQDKELCSEARGYVGCFRDPALYDLYLTTRPGIEVPAALDELDDVLARACRDAVSEEELERAKARIELATLQSLPSSSAKAEQIGFFDAVLGQPSALFDKLQAYRRCERSDLLRVARRYLCDSARTVIEVEPEAC